MDIHKLDNGVTVPIKVIPGSGEFNITFTSNRLVIKAKSPAQGGRANAEITAKLREFFGTDIKIVRGSKQSRKEIFVPLDEGTVLSKISKLSKLPGGENGKNRTINGKVRNTCNTHRKRRGGKA